MTWKTGDSVAIPIFFEDIYGTPQVYASAGAFVAAGGALTWYSGATALATQPSYTLEPIGTTGWHAIGFALPEGVDHILPTVPTDVFATPADYLAITPNNDLDSIASIIAAVTGSALEGTATVSRDFTIIEGDNFAPQSHTIPASALQFLDMTLKSIVSYADLSDITGQPWTVAAQARGAWAQLPADPVSFSFDAAVISKTNRQLAISFASSVPAGAKVCNADGTTDTTGTVASTAYKYDIQLVPPVGSAYAGRKLTVVVGTVTIIRQQTTTP